MHDIHAADQILKQALESAKQNNLKKITQITIELGQIEEHGSIIAPENLKFNLKLLAANTIAKNATLEIINVNGDYFTLKQIQGRK